VALDKPAGAATSLRMATITKSVAALRRATAADWDAIAALLSTSSLPIDGARDHLEAFTVATRGGVVVGCAGVERYGDVGLLRSVAVAPAERGAGTGARLVERCIADAAAAGCSTLVLLTTTAEHYFPRFGFERIAREAAPEAVRASVEFRDACPASATMMRLTLPAATGT
jgi:N-acetylglutamate synthase-like GNAT family acetyltransferase